MSIFANRRCLKNNVLFFYLGASTSNPFPQDPVYPPADVPSTLHRDHWRTIRTRQSRGNRVQDWYNFRLNSLNMGELVNDVERIFQDQTTVFKLNLSFGFVLFNNETEQMQIIIHPLTTTGYLRHRFWSAIAKICNRSVWRWKI